MTLKLPRTASSLDSIPEAAHGLYTETDEGYTLSAEIEGTAPREKVGEFREKNIALARELDELRRKYDGIDPEAFRRLQEQATESEDRKLIDAGKIDELVERRAARMREGFEAEVEAKVKAIEALTEERTTLSDKLAGYVIDDAVSKSLADVARVRPEAMDDLRMRARAVFRVDPKTGAIVPDAGGKMEFGKSGDALTLSEWSRGLVDKAGHLFESPKGSDAAGSDVPAPRLPGGRVPDDPVEFGMNLEEIAGIKKDA